MGRYTRKKRIKRAREVSPVGVRTRAKTLAMLKKNVSTSTHHLTTNKHQEESDSECSCSNNKLSYPNTRSRKTTTCTTTINSTRKVKNSTKKKTVNSCKKKRASSRLKHGEVLSMMGEFNVEETPNSNEQEVVAENNENEVRDRESTPTPVFHSFTPPGSTTKTKGRVAAAATYDLRRRGNAPSSHEMEDFFADAEQYQRRVFIERYNYDPVTDLPLPGRYEWIRV